jgi:hypothetical protein
MISLLPLDLFYALLCCGFIVRIDALNGVVGLELCIVCLDYFVDDIGTI